MNIPAAARLSDLFGSYKAEWLRDSIFDLFTEPAYFPELTTGRPCVLVGGRGTGKTTALRSLSYEGQYALSQRRHSDFRDVQFVGMYYRVNTNRISAFSGKQVSDEEWRRYFGHYINLVLCGIAAKMLSWYRDKYPNSETLSSGDCETISLALCAPAAFSEEELSRSIKLATIEFESYMNNIGLAKQPFLSMQGVPIDELFMRLRSLQCFRNKNFFFIIDEYENFLDYQQRALNTLIKHGGEHYSFKIGVRELGWRVRETLNRNEVLHSPADYVKISIPERLDDRMFEAFARDVCNARLARLREEFPKAISDVTYLLPGLSDEDEAQRLGVGHAVSDLRERLKSTKLCARKSVIEGLDDFRLFFLARWAAGQNSPLEHAIDDYAANREAWERRFSEYKYAYLFCIAPKSTGISKYYCGWGVYVSLCGKNIRYLLELIDSSVGLHCRSGGGIDIPISARDQTIAAQSVAKKNLSELEGLSIYGAHLTKLVLGLGRIFGVMAAEPEGHAAEVNQFKLRRKSMSARSPDGVVSADRLVGAAVMHLALLQFPATKRRNIFDTREHAYQLHPIFSPYFVISYKRGRDCLIEEDELLGLTTSPKSIISTILRKNNRSDAAHIPEQLMLFGGYYDGKD